MIPRYNLNITHCQAEKRALAARVWMDALEVLAGHIHLHRGRVRVAPTHPLQALERIQRPNKCVFEGRLVEHRLAQHIRRRKECSLFPVLHPFRREVAS